MCNGQAVPFLLNETETFNRQGLHVSCTVVYIDEVLRIGEFLVLGITQTNSLPHDHIPNTSNLPNRHVEA